MNINNIAQATDFIYSSYLKAEKHMDYNLPDKFKRNPEFTRYILARLNFEEAQSAILVTGSKGKGSVSVMLSEILQTCRGRVGLFTSPHITELNERIRVNKTFISDSDIIKYADLLYPFVKEIDSTQPLNKYVSPIGILAIMSLLFFKDIKTDINVFECGKGALYDDVNVLRRDYSVINTIFPEHLRELGKTIEEIAEDKSAVIKYGQKCAYTAQQSPSLIKIIRDHAESSHVRLKCSGRDFSCSNIYISTEGTTFDVRTEKNVYKDIRLPLLGEYQAQNCALAIAVCEDITGTLDEDKIKEALGNISWPGRLEIISHEPATILDACINRVSAAFVRKTLSLMAPGKVVTVIGIPCDKDYEGVVEEMSGISSKIILTTSTSLHYKFSEDQYKNARKYTENLVFIKNAEEAVAYAKKQTGNEGIICILGTTALVSDVKRMYP